MIAIGDKSGLAQVDASELFVKFRNHYLGSKTTYRDYVPIFENWVNDAVKAPSYTKTRNDLDNLQLNFYLSEQVSDAIEEILKGKGHKIEDVLAGKIVLDNVKFAQMTLPPPKNGKKTLFYYAERGRQSTEMQKIKRIVTGSIDDNSTEKHFSNSSSMGQLA